MKAKYQTQSAMRVLWIVLVVVALLGMFRVVMRSCFGFERLGGFGWLIDMDEEGNIPTLFNVILLLLASALSMLCCRFLPLDRVARKRGWHLLAAGFLFMAADEFVGIHDRIGRLAHALFGEEHFQGVFRFVWPIPALLLLVILACVFVPFFRHVPPLLRRGIFRAGVVYVFAAVGMEMIGGSIYESVAGGDSAHFGYSMMTVVEETLEMTGILLFISALLREFRGSVKPATIELV